LHLRRRAPQHRAFKRFPFPRQHQQNLNYSTLAQKMGKGNPALAFIINKVEGSVIKNQLFGTPVLSPADVIAQQQDLVRQQMLSFGKGPYSPQVLL
jgi:hypothetical protein